MSIIGIDHFKKKAERLAYAERVMTELCVENPKNLKYRAKLMDIQRLAISNARAHCKAILRS